LTIPRRGEIVDPSNHQISQLEQHDDYGCQNWPGSNQLACSLCWFRAATVKAPSAEGADSWVGGSFGERDGAQLIAHGKLQQWWNALAASFATAAALLTALDVVISR
jgi:hypothetical protein